MDFLHISPHPPSFAQNNHPQKFVRAWKYLLNSDFLQNLMSGAELYLQNFIGYIIKILGRVKGK